MTNLFVRRADPADAADGAAVWHEAWHDAHRAHVPAGLVAARDEAYFAARAEGLVAQMLVVDAPDGGLLGIAITEGDEVQQLMVAGAARGQGVGDALLAAAEQRIAMRHSSARLTVVPGNVSARRFYERRGWCDRGGEMITAGSAGQETYPVLVRRYVKPLP